LCVEIGFWGEANCRNGLDTRLAGGKVVALGVVIRSETPQVLAVECDSIKLPCHDSDVAQRILLSVCNRNVSHMSCLCPQETSAMKCHTTQGFIEF
jgi:hypothetical protein